MNPSDKSVKARDLMWIDFDQDADVVIETEDEGEIVVEAFTAFDYAVNDDAIKYVKASALDSALQEVERLEKENQELRKLLGDK